MLINFADGAYDHIMGRQRFLVAFIGAGTLLILLQQSSLQISNNSRHPSIESAVAGDPIHDNGSASSSARKFVVDVFQPSISSSSSSSSLSSSPAPISPGHSHQPSSSPPPSHSRLAPSSSRHYNPLIKFPIYNGPKNVSRVLLLTYFRSGSSYLGDVMQQNWKTFYTYEPLIFMTLGHKINATMKERALKIIRDIYNCDFHSIDEEFLIKWRKSQFLLDWNKFLHSVCRYRPPNCNDRRFISDTCKRSKYNLIKTTRLSMSHVEILWPEFSDRNLKVVFLVRDPRGIFNSRKSRDFCIESSGCTNIENICTEMRTDIEIYDRLKATTMSESLVLLRYEDISTGSAAATIKPLMESVGIPYSSTISRFVKTHTMARENHSEIKNPYSTFRTNSTAIAYQWMSQLNRSEIIHAQTVCGDVLKRLNYTILTLESE